MSSNPSSSKRPARILIVDDHPNTASTLARTLGQFPTPAEILTARSGQEALDVVNTNLVDILITDFMMPGMNGLELIEKLINLRREPTFTILITAYDSPGLAATARRLKVDEYLVKPFLPDKIRNIVNRVLTGLRQADSPAAEPASVAQSKILIADDWPDNVQLLATRLQSEGYVFISAGDGEDALNKIRAELPDLVLLDVDMPKKDGFEVLATMRNDAQIAHIPVIMLTAARTAPRDIREGLGLGADDYVTKPFDWRDLAARVRAKLRVKHVEDVLRRRNRELGVLPELGQDLSTLSNVEDIVATALKRSLLALQANVGFLVLYDPEDHLPPQIFFSAGVSASSELRAALLTRGAAEQIIATRQGVLIEDATSDPRWVSPGEFLPGNPMRTLVAVPLISRRGIIGALTLGHNRASFFQQEHVTLLQAIANQAAIAIENSHFYAVEQRRVNELVALSQLTREINLCFKADELFERIPQVIRALLGYPVVSLWVKDNDDLTMRTVAGMRSMMDAEAGMRPSLLGLLPQQVAMTGEAATFSGAVDERATTRPQPGRPPTHSAVAVPLVWDNAPNGVLAIHSTRTNAFQESDRVLLEMVAAQLTGALNRARWNDQATRQQRWLETVLAETAEALILLDAGFVVRHITSPARRHWPMIAVGQPLPTNPGLMTLTTALEHFSKTTHLPDQPPALQTPEKQAFTARLTLLAGGEFVIHLRDM